MSSRFPVQQHVQIIQRDLLGARWRNVLGDGGAVERITPLGKGLKQHRCVALAGNLYTFGGYQQEGYTSTTLLLRNCFRTLDLDGNAYRWEFLAAGPAARLQHAMAAVGDKIVVSCGEVDGTTWIYDPVADAWTAGTAFPGAVMEVTSSCEHDGYLWLINTSEFYRYDPVGDSWLIRSHPGFTTAVGNPGIISDGTYIYGLFKNYGLYRYDAAANTWTQVVALSTTFPTNTPLKYYDGGLWLFSGYFMDGGAYHEYYPPTIWRYDIANPNGFVPVGSLGTEMFYHDVTIAGGIAYIIGGERPGSGIYATDECLSVVLDSLPGMACGARAFAVDTLNLRGV